MTLGKNKGTTGRRRGAVAAAITMALAVGCQTPPEDRLGAEPAPATKARGGAPVAAPPVGAEPEQPAPSAGSVAAAPEAQPAPRRAEPEKGSSFVPEVKRLVVASSIEGREPVSPPEMIKVGIPVFAFVELENTGSPEGSIVITFEREGAASLGHVTLAVPAGAARWRTWGQTKLIRQAGTWAAVVRTKEGQELARREFDVDAA